jgi:hypothetical protein
MNVYSLYTDEDAVGMDHPLFMAKTQAGFDAGLAAANGVSLAEALRTIRARMQALFGDIPLALVDATVSMAYARYKAGEPGMVPPAVD